MEVIDRSDCDFNICSSPRLCRRIAIEELLVTHLELSYCSFFSFSLIHTFFLLTLPTHTIVHLINLTVHFLWFLSCTQLALQMASPILSLASASPVASRRLPDNLKVIIFYLLSFFLLRKSFGCWIHQNTMAGRLVYQIIFVLSNAIEKKIKDACFIWISLFLWLSRQIRSLELPIRQLFWGKISSRQRCVSLSRQSL